MPRPAAKLLAIAVAPAIAVLVAHQAASCSHRAGLPRDLPHASVPASRGRSFHSHLRTNAAQ